jgi:hypothetical protein
MNVSQIEKIENLAQRYTMWNERLKTLKQFSKGYHNVQNKLMRIEHRLMSKFIHQYRIAELNGDAKLMSHLIKIVPAEINLTYALK